MRLSPHFTLAEMTKSQLAVRRSLPNLPDDDAISCLKDMCLYILEPVRKSYGIPFSPTSAYRSIALNRALGSHDRSQHIRGEAVDFELPGISNVALAHWMAAHLEFDQLILEHHDPDRPHSGWVHCSFVRGANRGRVLTIGPAGVMKGLPKEGRDGASR